MRGAFAVLWLPFSWAASAPGNALALLRRSRWPAAGERHHAAARAGLDAGKWSLELLKRLEWRRFEELCLAYFQALGYEASAARPRPRGRLDIALRPEGAPRAAILVHCAGWDAYRIGFKPVRELRAAMDAAGLAEGMLVTCARFNQDAIALAARENIGLVDGAALLARLEDLPPETRRGLLGLALEGDFLTPTCPACAVKMTARTSTSEGRRFWGCRNYPQCKETLPGVDVPA